MISDDERVIDLQHEALRATRAKDIAFSAYETHRKFHMAEVREVNRLTQLVAVLENEIEFIKGEIGVDRFDAIVERYHALNDAALRRMTGYAFTKGEHA